MLGRPRATGPALVLLALLLFLLPRGAEAQQWLQTTRVIVPIEEGSMRALLDTLTSVMERKEGPQARRSPDQAARVPVVELRDSLLETSGIGLTSATHVFIDYRFEIGDTGFKEHVERLFFIFRPGTAEEDIPILSVDASEGWVKRLLRRKGTSLPTNEAALIPFRRQLVFARLARKNEGAQVVEIGGQTVREGYAQKKRRLVDKVYRLTYEAQ